MVSNIFLRIIYHLKSDDNDDLPFELLYSEEATRFLNEMLIQKSIRINFQ